MGNQKSQQELVRKVNMYLDNELSKEAERELLMEIKQNPVYFELLNKVDIKKNRKIQHSTFFY